MRRLQCTTQMPNGNATAPLAFMHAIRAHSSHWEELCLALPPACYESFFEHARSSEMPLLRRLTLLFHSAWPTSHHLLATRALTTAPLLTDISLINVPAQSSMLALPWNQITRFRGSHLHLADALDALDSAPLKSSAFTWALGYPAVDAPILHSNLSALTLEGNVTALKYLTLPALESLCIRTHRAFPAEQCIQFLLRSGCTLRSLDISVDFIATTSLVSCLEATPGLRELRVHNRKDRIHSLFGNFLLERLTLRDQKRDLVPRLQRLEALGCHCLFDAEVLGGMLESRWDLDVGLKPTLMGLKPRDVNHLESFCLEASHDASLTSWKGIVYSPRVWRLIEEGMDIELRHLDDVMFATLSFNS
ncbi:hypothetical protein DXG01_005625 [Tephrocybe rancida]|nr:hypothetical protein DXG01_005625 [Tephrocybe rancida]